MVFGYLIQNRDKYMTTKQEAILGDIQKLIGKSFTVFEDDKDSWIELVDIMPHPAQSITPEEAIVQAARTSYAGETKGYEKDMKLLKYLYVNRHTSPFEMVEFKFRLRAPLMVWFQWERHRTQSMNLESKRYSEVKEESMYIPSVWRKQSTDNKQGSDGMIHKEDQQRAMRVMYENSYGTPTEDIMWGLCGDLTDENLPDFSETLRKHYSMGYEFYRTALKAGVGKEQARLFLGGFGVYYTGVVKVNARNLMHFLGLRMDEHAQWEIRQYANVIHNEMFSKVMPVTAALIEQQ